MAAACVDDLQVERLRLRQTRALLSAAALSGEQTPEPDD